jgi:hypothetical protein
MRVEDLIIEVRDPSLNRIGQFRPGDLVGATFVLRFNNIGAWEMRLPYGHRLGEFLRLPGYGLIVTGPNDDVIMSGPTVSAKLEQTSEDIEGEWLITGADDSVLLNELLAYPNPTTDDVTNLGQAFDARLGPAESVIKDYVDANIGPSGVPARQVANLVIEPDLERGVIVQGNARFEPLQELLYGLAQTGGIGYRIVQEAQQLVFKVYEPTNLAAKVRLDLENQKLSRTEYSYANAKATRAIVGGQGEAQWRRFVEVSNEDSLAAEAEWGRRIEVFKDGRNSRVPAFLIQDGLELLVDKGKTIQEFSVTPSDSINMVYGVDWNLGDTVTVVTKDLEGSAVVTEIGISIGADGVRIGATVGTPVGVTYEAKILAKTQQIDERVSNLERSVTGYGINIPYAAEGGTNGTQPTWSLNPITASFNRFGNMMHFSVLVTFTDIISFGTGQYFVTLPEQARVAYQFRDGCLHDASTGTDYHISGHVDAGSNVLWLSTTGISGQRIFDSPFEQGAPVTLTSEDLFHIAGTYEIEG